MTEVGYMVREDWAQHGTAMEEQSAVIRSWLGDPPFLFFAPDLRKHHKENDADQEFVAFVAPDPGTRHVFDLGELAVTKSEGGVLPAAVIIHPFEDRDSERLRKIIDAQTVDRLFVIIWAPSDRVRVMLDALGAENVFTSERRSPADELMRRAARLMVDEEYNGLSSGRGKDAVIQLLRAFRDDGYDLDERTWLSALYAEGAKFTSGEVVATFIRQMKTGTVHRVRPRFVPEIIDLLRKDNAT
jgi:hypothetical protein